MIFKEFPTILEITPQYGDEPIEITVMFISEKLYDNATIEVFVAVGYDSEMKIHEAILNESKIIKTELYDRKIRSPRRRPGGTGGEKGTEDGRRDNNPGHEQTSKGKE